MNVGMTLGFIGCGQMARALLVGFIRHPELLTSISLFDIDTAKAQALAQDFGAKVADSGCSLAEEVDVVVLAVKPPQIKTVLREISEVLNADRSGSIHSCWSYYEQHMSGN